jgi:dTMP kinase
MAAAKRGLFITLEGPDGSGKSTQIKVLAKRLQAFGFHILVTREPGGGSKDSLAEKIRGLLLTPGKSAPNPQTELLLFLAARAQHVHECIQPALEKNMLVLCERFSDATLAYQVGGRKLPEPFVRTADAFARQGVQPQLTLLFDVRPEQGLKRAFQAKAGHDRMESESQAFYRGVRRVYLQLARQEPGRIKVIPAQETPEQVSERVWNEVQACLKQRGYRHALS